MGCGTHVGLHFVYMGLLEAIWESQKNTTTTRASSRYCVLQSLDQTMKCITYCTRKSGQNTTSEYIQKPPPMLTHGGGIHSLHHAVTKNKEEEGAAATEEDANIGFLWAIWYIRGMDLVLV